jgi:alkylation response protein AidB-like acyl-CoA dehydrogenase
VSRRLPHGRALEVAASELVLDDVRLPADAVLPEAKGLKGPLSCLSHARYGIVWGSMGAARACFEAAVEYAGTREQFGKPIGGFQLTQAKLADMAVECTREFCSPTIWGGGWTRDGSVPSRSASAS